ncbi:GNAT family N-acetyltransferase [Sphingobacterium oryzagri]|uniref:GNAT family N-acetyltransferase n=1 Tax=Sphingobacterium oryzagri TaxID=3025669 RepID=A0ABY7WEQ8_9SPHI|nr:GNAT family N-acetyltransferase [Sphingobacterium sp. KACC 22765]WDF67365.1 GNAT family N-acetyltransferase [Sphingobacterium sp. KACC 22765]
MLSTLQIEQVAAPVTWRLRQEVLYPNGTLKDVMIDTDFEGYHFGAYKQDMLVGVISLFQGENMRFQFRKFAVHTAHQRQGIGRALLETLRSFAKELGAREVWCHARVEAVDFYKAVGLQPSGELFMRNGMQYIRLVLQI